MPFFLSSGFHYVLEFHKKLKNWCGLVTMSSTASLLKSNSSQHCWLDQTTSVCSNTLHLVLKRGTGVFPPIGSEWFKKEGTAGAPGSPMAGTLQVGRECASRLMVARGVIDSAPREQNKYIVSLPVGVRFRTARSHLI